MKGKVLFPKRTLKQINTYRIRKTKPNKPQTEFTAFKRQQFFIIRSWTLLRKTKSVLCSFYIHLTSPSYGISGTRLNNFYLGILLWLYCIQGVKFCMLCSIKISFGTLKKKSWLHLGHYACIMDLLFQFVTFKWA